MRAHKAGDVKLITSSLSIAECVAVEPGQLDVPDDVQEHFKTLITSGQYVSLAPMTPRTGDIIQNLRWGHQIVLKGADCLHMATALEQNSIEFITTDDRLKKTKMVDAATKLVGKLRCNRAAGTLCLPPEYLQSDMPYERR
jgi:hypothetical protein